MEKTKEELVEADESTRGQDSSIGLSIRIGKYYFRVELGARKRTASKTKGRKTHPSLTVTRHIEINVAVTDLIKRASDWWEGSPETSSTIEGRVIPNYPGRIKVLIVLGMLVFLLGIAATALLPVWQATWILGLLPGVAIAMAFGLLYWAGSEAADFLRRNIGRNGNPKERHYD